MRSARAVKTKMRNFYSGKTFTYVLIKNSGEGGRGNDYEGEDEAMEDNDVDQHDQEAEGSDNESGEDLLDDMEA